MRRMFSKNQLEEQSIELLGSGKVPSIKGDEIIENMSGYSISDKHNDITFTYVGVVKNGNKITFALAGTLNEESHAGAGYVVPLVFKIPQEIGSKLFPFASSSLSYGTINMFSAYNTYKTIPLVFTKTSDTSIYPRFYDSSLTVSTDYYFRCEITFLLSDNLIS